MKPPSVITPEIRRQIEAEPPEAKYQAIANKFGVTWYHVKNIRMNAGLFPLQPKPKTEITATWPTREEIEGKVPAEVETQETKFDLAIAAIEEQLAFYQTALGVLQGLRELELADPGS